MNDFIFSKSKINTFIQCPRQFKYQYIDELKSEPNEYMELGLMVHHIAEEIGKEIKMGALDPEQAYDIMLERYSNPDFDLDSHISSLSSFFIDIINSGYKIFSIEEKISNATDHFRGIVDIVLEDQNGDLIIFDYKTSKKTKPITKFRLELCIYKNLLEYKYPDKTVVTAGIFFTNNNDYRVANFTDNTDNGAYITTEDYNYVLSLPGQILPLIDQGIYLPKRQYNCKFCYYSDQCIQDGGF